jgi:hypothetical protein
MKTIWISSGERPENAENFARISQWWASLSGQTVTWRQRLLDPEKEVEQLDWEPQRFDDKFEIANPQVRGITLYWNKPGSPIEHNTTVRQLELDTLRQQLYVYPQSQQNLVIRVGLPEIEYRKLKLNISEIEIEGDRLIIARDGTQLIEVQLTLSPEQIAQLKRDLPA